MPDTQSQNEPELPRHPVRVVAQRTGLSSHVLRAWERRYGVVTPTRTEGGQRLYSDADIERLILLRTLTSRGGAISQLAQLPQGDLARRVEEDRAARSGSAAGGGEVDAAAARWREAALLAVETLDGAVLRRQLERAVVGLGTTHFLEGVVGPVLTEIGDRWRAGDLGIAHAGVVVAGVDHRSGLRQAVEQVFWQAGHGGKRDREDHGVHAFDRAPYIDRRRADLLGEGAHAFDAA